MAQHARGGYDESLDDDEPGSPAFSWCLLALLALAALISLAALVSLVTSNPLSHAGRVSGVPVVLSVSDIIDEGEPTSKDNVEASADEEAHGAESSSTTDTSSLERTKSD